MKLTFKKKKKKKRDGLLSKKLQRILRDKKNNEKRKTLPQKKKMNRNDQGKSSNTSITSNTQSTCFKSKKLIGKLDCLIYLKKLLENERKKIKLTSKDINLAT